MLISACSGPAESPEQQLHDWLVRFEKAVEQGALADAADLIAPSYSDDHHPNKSAAMRTLFALRHRHRTAHLFTLTDTMQINADGRRATIGVHVAMTGVPVDSARALLALNADLYRFDLDLLQRDDQWLLNSSRWQRANPGELFPSLN